MRTSLISWAGALTFCLSMGQVVWAQGSELGDVSSADAALFQDEALYHSRCRGGSGDDPATGVACGIRDYIDYLLNQSGYCYGEAGQPSFEMVWHLCGANSWKVEKP